MTPRVLITDLDNTLYDWVTFFAKSFDAMVERLTQLLESDRQTLLSQFKEIHQRYGSTESPWSALELPSARLRYPQASMTELAECLSPAFETFSTARANHLRLYDGVAETLAELASRGVTIIGHTEAMAVNAYHRLYLLGIVDRFARLYTLEGKTIAHPFPDRPHTWAPPPPGLIRKLPLSERKPNPEVLRDICQREGFNVDECVYVGDSLTRDVSMAKRAGARAVWARYGTKYDPALWNILVAVTHWTPEDVDREARLKESFRNVRPDATIDRFDQILSVGAYHQVSSLPS
jgi:FMN phosphatase YigB (HAD superfamily)